MIIHDCKNLPKQGDDSNTIAIPVLISNVTKPIL